MAATYLSYVVLRLLDDRREGRVACSHPGEAFDCQAEGLLRSLRS